MFSLRLVRATATRRLLPPLASSFSSSPSYRNSNNHNSSEKKKSDQGIPDVNVAQPHIPNRSSTLGGDVPKVGAANAPPELLHHVNPDYKPLETSGEAKKGEVSGSQNPGHSPEVNHTDWTKLKHEPLSRANEDEGTTRARLVYQSRKRGILETDLLLSTFADAHLSNMNVEQMAEYDEFLNENDWDIYYWCTQEPPVQDKGLTGTSTAPTSHSNVTPKSNKTASPTFPDDKIRQPAGAVGMGSIEQQPVDTRPVKSAQEMGEWAQTVGTVRQPYRDVPARWASSEILKKLREHVETRKARGEGDTAGKGMGRMPDMKSY